MIILKSIRFANADSKERFANPETRKLAGPLKYVLLDRPGRDVHACKKFTDRRDDTSVKRRVYCVIETIMV